MTGQTMQYVASKRERLERERKELIADLEAIDRVIARLERAKVDG